MSQQLATEAYWSSVKVIVATASGDFLDVSDDVISCSVSRRMDAVSTCSVSLVNYSAHKNGRYNGKICIGDRVYVGFIKNSQTIDAFTGRISQVPVIAFNESKFDFSAGDVIQDLQYIYWDPYSNEAQTRYSMTSSSLQQWAATHGQEDCGIGIALRDFLCSDQGVCHLPEDAVKIYKFPAVEQTLQSIIDLCAKNRETWDDDGTLDDHYEDIYNLFFGDPVDTSSGSVLQGIDEDGDGVPDAVSKSDRDGIVNPTVAGSLKNMCDAINIIVHGANGAKGGWDARTVTNVMFKQGDGWEYWDWHDNSDHTGGYGLSRDQMKKHAGLAWPAFQCKQSEQTKAMKSILKDIGSGSNAPDTIFFYFTGQHLTKKKNGKIDYSKSNGAVLKIGNVAFTDYQDWVDYISGLIGSTREYTGSTNDDVRDKKHKTSKKTTKKSSNKGNGNKKANSEQMTAFNTWVDRVIQSGGQYSDTNTRQCWELWHRYYLDFLKLDAGQWAIQPPTGNDGYYQAFPQNQYLADNFEKLGKDDQWQAGDVFFCGLAQGISDSYYGHTGIVTGDNGTTVSVVDQGASMPTGRRTYPKSGMSGAIRPKKLGGMSNSVVGGGSSGTSASSMSAQDWARSETFKLFKFVTFMNPTEMFQSQVLGSTQGTMTTGLYLANDKPAIEYVSACCKSSMRSYMSAPDGSFVAFVPDWFGMINPNNSNTATIDIPEVETKTFSITMDKSSYVSHYFLTTSESMPNTLNYVNMGALDETLRLMQSSGTITMQYQAEALCSLMDLSSAGVPNTPDGMAQLMKQWGISVRREDNEYIQDHTLTTIYALYQFLKYWANCFKSRIDITFRPEIIPGCRVRFPWAENISLFVEECTHSWSAASGGSTSLTLTSPMKGERFGV